MRKKLLTTHQKQHNSDHETNSWLNRELAKSVFTDKRLKQRFKILLKNLWQGIGETIPFACQDWANTKAAYRFFSNQQISEMTILKGHFESTCERVTMHKEPILILHDTTEFSYQRAKPEKIGKTYLIPNGKDLFNKPKYYTKCGILMHSSLAITTTGLPLGLTAIKFWTRKEFKGTDALKNHINATRISIHKKESYRWLENLENTTDLLGVPEKCIHVGDRDGDIFELYDKAKSIGTHFVIRTHVNRIAGDGRSTTQAIMNSRKCKGGYDIQFTDKQGKVIKTRLQIKYERINILPSISKQKLFAPIELTVIHAVERKPKQGRERIVWKLVTDLPVTSLAEAIEKLQWYALRWKIEVFHKNTKVGL